MKKVKKWQVFVLVIFGIGGYWLSQNLWVFEPKVEIYEYEESLKDSKWLAESGGIWDFNSEGGLTINNRDYFDNKTWRVDNELLITKNTNDHLPNTWKIKTFRDSFIRMILISPPLNGRRPQKILIKYDDK